MRGWSQHLALGEKEGGLAEVTVAEKQRRMAQNDTRGMTQGTLSDGDHQKARSKSKITRHGAPFPKMEDALVRVVWVSFG